MVDTSARKHSIVLNLGTAERRAVGGDKDELSLSLTKSLQGGLVSEAVLTTLHDQSQARVNGLSGFLLYMRKCEWFRISVHE